MAELLGDEDIQRELASLPGWAREAETLTRTWEMKGFSGAVQLANVVAYTANRLNHHPNISVHDYNRVTVTTTTHDSGGITTNDVALARTIERALAEAG